MTDDDLIRRGDALEFCEMFPYPKSAIAALPAQGVRVKPLVWKPTPQTGMLRAVCPLFNTIHIADDADDAAQHDAVRTARILAAIEPAELAGVETIKDALASLDMARDKLIAALNAGEK